MGLKAEFDNFYKNAFGDWELLHRVFYNFPIGIRFEIGTGYYSDKGETYVKDAVCRAKTIFAELFDENDDIFLLVNSFEDNPNDLADNDITTVRPLINHIQDECKFTFTSVYDVEFTCERYIIKAAVKDIQVEKLIEAIAWSDIDRRNSLYGCVYWVNPRNNIICWLYSDQGLDVISNKTENLRHIYIKFNDWILDFDREKIDATFA